MSETVYNDWCLHNIPLTSCKECMEPLDPIKKLRKRVEESRIRRDPPCSCGACRVCEAQAILVEYDRVVTALAHAGGVTNEVAAQLPEKVAISIRLRLREEEP